MENSAIFDKHRGIGSLVSPVVCADDQVVVSHRPLSSDGNVVAGYLFVETRRHTRSLNTLTDSEVIAVARAVHRVAQALDALYNPEHVFTFIAGRTVPHFHQHVFTRHRGTPESISWNNFETYSGALFLGASALAESVAELRSLISLES
ncbi:MAG: HIT domain-containing protein [Gordonia sp. (in: high G+C Gram-positive bacteria)]